ncbi:MAG TPA: oligopeptide/dipeptide ABC transporter ATP-binding protein [Steroidobacteraceae bacterium]|nr:oligopeptide/dipeptide ABC transporter ATP-binding protein [Steroidobacteraceae bacterium]
MSEPLLEVKNLRVEFAAARDPLSAEVFAAIDDVSFEIGAGETLGLVGESGSGKSTLARAILRLIPAARGQVLWRGRNLLTMGAQELRSERRNLQLVFQDPLASLDPRMRIGEILGEPLEIFEPSLSATDRQIRIERMLGKVGLAAEFARRFPHEFSGGQCQRIAIARAMMPGPRILICDEAVSSLDVSIQGQIVNLLGDLQRELGMGMLFISHNLGVVRHISRRVLVLFGGSAVELAPRERLFAAAAHPYTRALLAATPGAHPQPLAAPAELLAAEAAPAEQTSGGCVFFDRCIHRAGECRISAPRLEQIAELHFVACHRWRQLPAVAPSEPQRQAPPSRNS